MKRIALAVSHDRAGWCREQPIADALKRLSFSAEVLDWQDPYVRWPDFDCVVIRSTWTYHIDPGRFLDWVGAVSRKVSIINRPSVIQWNIHKRYLCELAASGMPVVPTRLKLRADTEPVSRLLATLAWPDAVVKPAIDVGGIGAHRISLAEESVADAIVRELVGKDDVIVQPYVKSITELGETLLVFVNNEFSHAVRRLPAPGEFLTHEIHGGSVELVSPTRQQLRVAWNVLQALPVRPVIARIDLVDMDGAPAVQEAELIDPCVYPELKPSVAEAVSLAIAAELG
jgi:glutathione synthase/RimK-type ligase-like ATP-grasp enzyme